MNVEFLAKLTNLDIVNNTLVFKLEFISPEIQANLQNLNQEQGKLKLKITSNSEKVEKSKEYWQQKCWFGSIKKILLAMEVEPTSQNVSYFDKKMRESIFPVKYIEFGDTRCPEVPSMKELTFDEMQNCINILQERYLRVYPDIDFSNLRG